MLFNSFAYIFVFLPLVFAVYFILNRYGYYKSSRLFLLAASIYFYSIANWAQLLRLLFLSMVFNYWAGVFLMKKTGWYAGMVQKKALFIFAIAANLSALAYFKYMGFFIENMNWMLGTNYPVLHILLPLGISFVVFEEIIYLTDSYLGKTKQYSFSQYALFVTFFPHLIAGPIIHYKEIMDQFDDKKKYFINWDNIASGLFLFTAGLFKKVMIADTFAVWATHGFDHYSAPIGFFAGWAISLSYTLQLYFDFSGYTDMAIGVAKMFNITLPINFNSPYKALDIQDFWRRWHITLSRFLRDYLYIPLGGSRKGEWRTHGNLFIVFLLGGLWHGAGWTFVIWGALHGVAIILFKMWQKLNITLPRFAAWLITFIFINFAWVFFRAGTIPDALKIVKGMIGLHGVALPAQLQGSLGWLSAYGFSFGFILAATGESSPGKVILWIIAFLLVVVFAKNTGELAGTFRSNMWYLILILALFFISLYHLNNYSEFIYFRF